MCSACGGSGKQDGKPCPPCGGGGRERLTGCPLTMIDAEAWEFIAAAELAEKGTWPVGGGWLEQTDATLRGVRLVWADQAIHRTAKGL